MSWDLSVMAFDCNPPPVETLSKEWCEAHEIPMGNAAETWARIVESLPEGKALRIEPPLVFGPEYSLEFNIKDTDEPVRHFSVSLRGSGDEALATVARILERTGWFALDVQATKWVHGAEDTESWHRFQAYRDTVIANPAHSRRLGSFRNLLRGLFSTRRK